MSGFDPRKQCLGSLPLENIERERLASAGKGYLPGKWRFAPVDAPFFPPQSNNRKRLAKINAKLALPKFGDR